MKGRKRQRQAYMSAEGRAHPDTYSAVELHQFLVHDAVLRHPTDLAWTVLAYKRIGEIRYGSAGKGSDKALNAVLDEVEQLTGLRELPSNG
jgi:hypothetical protein